TGRGTRGDLCPGYGAVVARDLDLHGGAATRGEDLACSYGLDAGHGCLLHADASCRVQHSPAASGGIGTSVRWAATPGGGGGHAARPRRRARPPPPAARGP